MEFDEKDFKEFKLNEEWAFKQFTINETDSLKYFWASKQDICIPARYLIKDIRYSEISIKVREFFEENLFSRLAWDLNRHIKGNLTFHASELYLLQAVAIYDNYHVATLHGKDHPEFDNLTLEYLYELYKYQSYELFFGDDILRSIGISKLFNEMLEITEKVVEDEENSPKVVFFAGHGTNIKQFLINLLMEAEAEGNHDFIWNPYAILITFYVIKEHENGETKYFVEAYFDDMPLRIKGCAGTRCSLKYFQRLVRTRVMKDFDDYCATNFTALEMERN